MTRATLRACAVSVLSVALINTGFVSVANAGVVDTAVIVSQSRDADLASVRAHLDRNDVRQQFEKMGVAPESVDARIASLSDSELRQLAQDMESAPAGGDALAIIGAVFLVLMVLEFVGVIDIFKK